ncbi:MAG: hypothetical protein AB2L18_08745 [Anaerolineaceae bacterium]
MNEQKKELFVTLLFVTCLSCSFLTPEKKVNVSTETRTFENEFLSFTIPAGWGTKEEVWERQNILAEDFNGLGVREIISIQHSPIQGQVGGSFALESSSSASGEDLESRFTQTYKNPYITFKDVSKQPFKRGALSGHEIIYTRPIGEPWWQFHDIWLEKDGLLYILSFHTLTNGFENYSATFDQILDSFQFED